MSSIVGIGQKMQLRTFEGSDKQTHTQTKITKTSSCMNCCEALAKLPLGLAVKLAFSPTFFCSSDPGSWWI